MGRGWAENGSGGTRIGREVQTVGRRGDKGAEGDSGRFPGVSEGIYTGMTYIILRPHAVRPGFSVLDMGGISFREVVVCLVCRQFDTTRDVRVTRISYYFALFYYFIISYFIKYMTQ